MKKALFLDRDGTINQEKGFITDPREVEIIPGIEESLLHFQKRGFLIIVITNQSGVGRGLFSREDVERVNQRVGELLSRKGVSITAFYYCPHAPEENCECRKPRPGLFLKASREWDIDLKSSLNVGDTLRDLEAGIEAGIEANYLVLTGKGRETLPLIRRNSLLHKVRVINSLRELKEVHNLI